MTGLDGADVFSAQAAVARGMGSQFTARVLETLARQLGMAPRTARRIADWPGDRRADNVALRVNGALHALARRGATPALAALYHDLDGDFDAVLGEVLEREDGFVAHWLDAPPQTNEVGRSAALWAALLVIARRFGPRVDLLELGSSAGLNLNLARYAYDLGGLRTGAEASPVRIAPEWRGPAPEPADVEVVRARGVDIAPLDPRDPAARERLLAFVWAEDAARSARLEQALALAADHPPQVARGDAADWLADRLAEPPEAVVARVVMHSIVLQYLSAAGRRQVDAALQTAARQATASAPLAHVAFEWDAARGCAALVLTTWPDGEARELATCQAHAGWIAWSR